MRVAHLAPAALRSSFSHATRVVRNENRSRCSFKHEVELDCSSDGVVEEILGPLKREGSEAQVRHELGKLLGKPARVALYGRVEVAPSEVSPSRWLEIPWMGNNAGRHGLDRRGDEGNVCRLAWLTRLDRQVVLKLVPVEESVELVFNEDIQGITLNPKVRPLDGAADRMINNRQDAVAALGEGDFQRA